MPHTASSMMPPKSKIRFLAWILCFSRSPAAATPVKDNDKKKAKHTARMRIARGLGSTTPHRVAAVLRNLARTGDVEWNKYDMYGRKVQARE
jgi:hypothetical protein